MQIFPGYESEKQFLVFLKTGKFIAWLLLGLVLVSGAVGTPNGLRGESSKAGLEEELCLGPYWFLVTGVALDLVVHDGDLALVLIKTSEH